MRQRLLHLFYPFLRFINSGKNDIRVSNKIPLVPVYELQAETATGEIIFLSKFKGKKILLINIASGCGYTRQLEGLEALSKKFQNLQVLAFPSNEFRNQEPLTDNEISEFCRLNYGVSFPVIKKTYVLKTGEQHPVFRWLTSSELNGWNNESPKWNFSKYLLNEKGALVAVTGPATDPLSREFIELVK